MRRAVLLGLLLAALAAPRAAAAPFLGKIGDFTQPTYATSPPGDADRVFVTERTGRVQLLLNGLPRAQPFLDLSAITLADDDERGLLSIAFAPDYATSGRFFVYLTAAGGEIQIREYRRSADPNLADPASGRVLVAITHNEAANHNGGQLQFGPDGKLYAGTGDGGSADDRFHHSQDPASLLGKLLRLDVSQPAPAPEILAVGLRNPWRFSFDRQTGQLVIGDVGQDAVEEVDVGPGANYGWPCKEGTRDNVADSRCQGVATAAPVLERPHSAGVCSITGGYVVRDPGLPTLAGRYIYGDFCAPALRSVNLADATTDAPIGLDVANLSSFGEDACGRILVVSLAGPVYRLIDGAPSPCGAPAPPPADTRPCALAFRVTGLHRVGRRHRLSVALRANEACRARLTAHILGVTWFKTAIRSLAAGRRTVVKLRLTKRGTRVVKHALRHHRRLRVVLRIRTVDGAGNAGTAKRTARIRRR